MRGMKSNRNKQLSKILSLFGINMKNVEALQVTPDLMSTDELKEAETCARFRNHGQHFEFPVTNVCPRCGQLEGFCPSIECAPLGEPLAAETLETDV